jgi:DNA-binding response OmpR family regulator
MSETVPEIPTRRLGGLRILVVEDDRLLLGMLEDALTVLGCSAIRASDVAEAAQLVATTPVDAAVLDLNVAGEKVYPVAEELERRGVPFLFVTGYVDTGVRTDYRSRPLLKKPFRVRDLERNLEALMAPAGK